jgi:PmbA protein
MEIQEITEIALNAAINQGAEDVSTICYLINENQIRFSNNSITLNNNFSNLELFLYISMDRRRIAGTTSNLTKEGIKNFTGDLIKACKTLPQTLDFVSLPKTESKLETSRSYDTKFEEVSDTLVELTKGAIDSALSGGAERISGSLSSTEYEIAIMTSGGADCWDKKTKYLANVRAFKDDASGHGLSCASNASDFNPYEAGKIAGEYSIKSRNPKAWKEGNYDLIVTPTVGADIIQHIGLFASAFSVDTGISFLANKIGEEVSVKELTLRDYGVIEGGLDGRIFDDEGLPTKENVIIEHGRLKKFLHNSSTAKKFNTTSTANAGIIDPHPWNLVVDSGKMDINDMITDVKRGILVTNNWYTRFQNMRTGEFSTLPRDATFLIENGSIKHPIRGTRISDNLPRLLMNIQNFSKERKWIEWWEVSVPTLSPSIHIKDVSISKALGS